MDLEQILKQMETNDEQQKIASAPPQTPPAANPGALVAALEKAAGVPPTQNDNVIVDLMKMAEQLAGSEKEAELSLAAMLGQAFADAAINKFAAYDAQTKIAMAQQAPPSVTPEEFKKLAEQMGYTIADEPQNTEYQQKLAEAQEMELVKMAAQLGYAQTQEKIAAEYKEGYDQAMLEVRNTAANEFIKGAQEAAIMIEHHRAAQAG